MAVRLPANRQLPKSGGQTVLFLFIRSEGREGGVVNCSSISFARTVTRERGVHDHQIELSVANSTYKIPHLLRTTSARGLCRGLDDLERWPTADVLLRLAAEE